MIKRLGIIFSGLLILLLLSNINYNAKIQVLAQQNASVSTNTSAPMTPDVVSNITKLTGGVKIMSPDKGDLVPLNSNKSLVIHGISKDNATSDCDVSVIINNVKPYQNVQPTGAQGANDYSNWQYIVSSNYTNINEGNNKITSKILCLGGPQTLQAYYSVNITATNFTQPQLSTYTMMLESSNSTANGGNMSQVSGGLQQPFAQIQQFNQDTGNGPICCKIAGSSPGQVNAVTDTTAVPPIIEDDTEDVATTNEEEEVEEENNDEDSNRNEEEEVEEENNDDNNNDDNNNDDNNNDDNNNDDNDGGSDSIMDDVEDTINDSGIDFSFD
jgi:hypothetical protein